MASVANVMFASSLFHGLAAHKYQVRDVKRCCHAPLSELPHMNDMWEIKFYSSDERRAMSEHRGYEQLFRWTTINDHDLAQQWLRSARLVNSFMILALWLAYNSIYNTPCVCWWTIMLKARGICRGMKKRIIGFNFADATFTVKAANIYGWQSFKHIHYSSSIHELYAVGRRKKPIYLTSSVTANVCDYHYLS